MLTAAGPSSHTHMHIVTPTQVLKRHLQIYRMNWASHAHIEGLEDDQSGNFHAVFRPPGLAASCMFFVLLKRYLSFFFCFFLWLWNLNWITQSSLIFFTTRVISRQISCHHLLPFCSVLIIVLISISVIHSPLLTPSYMRSLPTCLSTSLSICFFVSFCIFTLPTSPYYLFPLLWFCPISFRVLLICASFLFWCVLFCCFVCENMSSNPLQEWLCAGRLRATLLSTIRGRSYLLGRPSGMAVHVNKTKQNNETKLVQSPSLSFSLSLCFCLFFFFSFACELSREISPVLFPSLSLSFPCSLRNWGKGPQYMPNFRKWQKIVESAPFIVIVGAFVTWAIYTQVTKAPNIITKVLRSVPGSTRVITHRGVFRLRAGVQK